MSSRRYLLAKLLETLVEEWGEREVKSALDHVMMSSEPSPTHRGSVYATRSRGLVRSTATDLVKRSEAPEDTRELLLSLAERFDKKEFLPSVADIRQFIIMAGQRPAPMKDRSEAFRMLLGHLLILPVDRLKQVVQMAANTGPAQLGPISDAISAAGEHLPRRSRAADPKSEPRDGENGTTPASAQPAPSSTP